MSGSDAPRELSISRFIAAPPEIVWQVWTTRMTEWFTPAPWKTVRADYDLRPGGRAFVEMESPEGQRFPNDGVVLEVISGRKVVTTDAFTSGWVPQGPFMVTETSFEPEGDGTRYTATVRHWTDEALKQHQEMGFEQGWGAVAAQLADIAEAAARTSAA